MSSSPSEPHDYHAYDVVRLDKDTFLFCERAVQYYLQLLEKEKSDIEKDEDLAFFGITGSRRTKFQDEIDATQEIAALITRVKEEGGEQAVLYRLLSITHELIRFLKTAGTLYLKRLKQKRNQLSLKPNVLKYALEEVDTQISSYEEKLNRGVFANATLFPILVDDLIEAEPESAASEPSMPGTQRPRPVIIDSIEILDAELRARCLDLFAQFRESGSHERLDTVIGEGTKILEVRLRRLAGLEQTCIGVDLATKAFGGDDPILRVSEIKAEQDAAHLLYRGVFGFIRNPAQHRLLGELNPERVLQILGFLDYLLHRAETAERTAESE